ncbi:extracellular solute-binding protein [Paenibacillus silvae]|uniref:extracellular solute-binding protein n=1 Tax=Paenibacillus silvae TaxID=1325358 RepID=UPI0011A7051D|nr:MULTISPECIES: extracellular solute-binding protein [Paenibacillus]MCK6078006.1 extracellular solute-binding protein [Paenibacillus silvae]MCK6152205.1 extracellular solute-binding protein [Paenibacillus silvae]MCK6270889.1 extracellular solute-binding protein [Paenibacillus silvae]
MKSNGNQFTKRIKWFIGGVTASLLTLVLVACGAASDSQDATADGKLSLNIMMIQQGSEPVKRDNPILKQIEEYTNTQLNITWVPASAYDDKVSATIASGKLPDLMLARRNKDSAMLNAQLSGYFWDLAPYLKDTINLSKMSEEAVKNATVNGSLYGIPRERVLARYGMIFRKDWLDNLGLKEPKTAEDLYTIAKAFTENDPDQDGQKNTFGIQEDSSMELLKQLTIYNGGPNAWGLKDNKVTPDFMYPEFKEALDLYRKMVSEGIISPDFSIAKKYEYFNKGRAGIYFSVIDDAVSRHVDMMKLNDKTEIDVTQNFEGPSGVRVRGTNGYDSLLVIPKSSVTSEEKLKKIIHFLDQLGDGKIRDLIAYGIEGTDYTLENGKVKKTEGTAGTGDLFNLRWGSPAGTKEVIQTELEKKVDQSIMDHAEMAVTDLSASLISETNTEKGANLSKDMVDANTKYVLGELDEQGWNAAVAKWRSGGGDQIIEEFTTYYNEHMSP